MPFEEKKIEIKDEPHWEQSPPIKDLSVCLENVLGASQAFDGSTSRQENADLFDTSTLKNFTVNPSQGKPITDLNALYKENLLNFEKQYYYQNILHNIMETSDPKQVKELEKQYMEQLQKASKLDVFKCSKCKNYATIQKLNIKLHLLLVHDTELENKILHCKKCEFVSTDPIVMKEHVLNTHTITENISQLLKIKHVDIEWSDDLLDDKECSNNFDNNSDLDNTDTENIIIQYDDFDNKSCEGENRNSGEQEEIFLSEDRPIEITVKSRKKNLHKCPKCKKEFLHKISVMKHLKYNKCQNIPDDFKVTLDHRLRRRVYTCSECFYKCFNKNFMERHALSHKKGQLNVVVNETRNKTNIYNCPKCSFDTHVRGKFLKHIKLHKNDETTLKIAQELTLKHQCDVCDHQTNNEIRFKIHKMIHKRNPGVGTNVKEKNLWHCPEAGCKYKINRIITLTTHVLKTHRAEEMKERKQKVCEECGKLFNNVSDLKRHILARHKTYDSAEQLFYCYHCEYKTKIKHHLRTHVHLHLTRQKYVCGICGHASGNRKWNHDKHMQTHETVEQNVFYTCEFCNYCTKFERCFALHMKLGQHGDRETRRPKLFYYKCKKCDYQTLHYKSYHSHVSKNHPDIAKNDTLLKKCLLCNFETTSRGQIILHKRQNHDKQEMITKKRQLIEENQMLLKKENEKRERQKNTIREKREPKTERTEPEYRCSVCVFSTMDISNLESHLKKHEA